MNHIGSHFFRDLDGYYLNLDHVVCARPYPDEAGQTVFVQMTTDGVIGWSKPVPNDPTPKPMMFQRQYFTVLRQEWERAVAAARGEAG